MGQQLNKVIKRRRRAAYIKRKHELAKQGITRRASRTAKTAAPAGAEKKPAKKPAAKKAAKKAAPKTEEGTAPAAE